MYLGAAVIGNGGGTRSIFLPRALPLPTGGPVLPGPMPVAPDRPIITGPYTNVGPIGPPTLVCRGDNCPQVSSPVPAGFPTNQIFVAADGSFWEFSPSQNKWINVGTPYNTAATATPPAPPPSSSGASTMPPSTVAPAPVPASATPIITSSYQEILDWLNQDSLLGTIGVAGIPNWITAAGVALIIYKVSSKQGRR